MTVADIVNYIILVLTGGIIFWYSLETRRMRLLTDRQIKNSTEPFMFIDFFSWDYGQGLIDDDVDINETSIETVNLGGGVAFNVTFEVISGLSKEFGVDRDVQLMIPNTSIAFPGNKYRLAIRVFDDGHILRGSHPHPYLIPRLALDKNGHGTRYDIDPEKTHWKTHEYNIKIKYNDIYGNDYSTILRVDKAGVHLVSHDKRIGKR